MFNNAPSGIASHTGADVVASARTWLGTPYHHQASRKGIGADCLGLVRGVYRDLHDKEPARIPPYSRGWFEASDQELLLDAARLYLVPRSRKILAPGDVLVFRPVRNRIAKHLGIATYEGRMIHAQEGHSVAEVPVTEWWRRRLAGTFHYPGVTD